MTYGKFTMMARTLESWRRGKKPTALITTRAARHLGVERLDARVVLSASGFVGAAFTGPAIPGELPVITSATFFTRSAGDDFVGELRFENYGPMAWTDARQTYGTQSSFESADNTKPWNSGWLDLEISRGPSFAISQPFVTFGSSSFNALHGSGTTSIGSSSPLVIGPGGKGGLGELYVGRSQTVSMFVVSLQSLIESIYDLPSGRDDFSSKSQPPSPLAYNSSQPGGGKQSSPIFEGGSVIIANQPSGSQLGNSQVFTAASSRGVLDLVAGFASPTITTTSLLGRSDAPLSAVQSSPAVGRTFGGAAEGGLVDIGAKLNAGKLSLPRLSADLELDSASPADNLHEGDQGDDQDIAQFWSDLGQELESLDPAELALDADAPQIDGAVIHDASAAVALAEQAMAIHNGEGGMVELSVNQNPATTLPSASGDVRATAQTRRQANPKSVEIEMDAAVAMFQAFELETAPRSERRAADDMSVTSDVEADETDGEKPQSQPVDQAGLGPMSILLAIATTAKGDRKARQQKRILGKDWMVR